jgi:hypothetical protein
MNWPSGFAPLHCPEPRPELTQRTEHKQIEGGWALLVPLLGVPIYLIVRGGSMADRLLLRALLH